jgi:hypothetical protein
MSRETKLETVIKEIIKYICEGNEFVTEDCLLDMYADYMLRCLEDFLNE